MTRFDVLTNEELRDELRSRNMPTDGVKADLIERLEQREQEPDVEPWQVDSDDETPAMVLTGPQRRRLENNERRRKERERVEKG